MSNSKCVVFVVVIHQPLSLLSSKGGHGPWDFNMRNMTGGRRIPTTSVYEVRIVRTELDMRRLI